MKPVIPTSLAPKLPFSCLHMAEILRIRRKTSNNQAINPSFLVYPFTMFTSNIRNHYKLLKHVLTSNYLSIIVPATIFLGLLLALPVTMIIIGKLILMKLVLSLIIIGELTLIQLVLSFSCGKINELYYRLFENLLYCVMSMNKREIVSYLDDEYFTFHNESLFSDK